MGFRVGAKVDDLDAVQHTLAGLKKSMRNKILRKAIRQASKATTKAAKANAPVDTGLLRKSIGSKIKTYKSGVVVAIIGPRTGYRRAVDRSGRRVKLIDVSRKSAPVDAEIRNPVNYAHLIELGTVTSAPRPFLRPALQQTQGEVAAIVGEQIVEGLADVGRR